MIALPKKNITIPHSQFLLDISIVIDITQARKTYIFSADIGSNICKIWIITQADLSNKSLEIENWHRFHNFPAELEYLTSWECSLYSVVCLLTLSFCLYMTMYIWISAMIITPTHHHPDTRENIVHWKKSAFSYFIQISDQTQKSCHIAAGTVQRICFSKHVKLKQMIVNACQFQVSSRVPETRWRHYLTLSHHLANESWNNVVFLINQSNNRENIGFDCLLKAHWTQRIILRYVNNWKIGHDNEQWIDSSKYKKVFVPKTKFEGTEQWFWGDKWFGIWGNTKKEFRGTKQLFREDQKKVWSP